MAEHWKNEAWAKEFWYSGKVTRRRLLGLGATAAGALGATMLVPAPWRDAFGQAKPFKLGTLQPLSGTAAAGGKTALVGVQMAVDRINKSGGVNGRPIELLVADYESKPDVGRRKAEKLVIEDKIDAHAGGYLSNVCLACMPVYEEHKLVNMITVCLDTTITQSKCSRYTFRPFDFAPAQAVAAAPYMVNKMGKKWHIAYADYAWGQSTKDAFAAEIKKNGGEVVGTTGIPLGTADMTPFLSKITGSFDGLFGIFFGPQGIAFVTQSFDLGLTKKYKLAGDGAIAVSVNIPALGSKGEGFVGIDRYVPVLEGAAQHPVPQAASSRTRRPASSRSTRPGRFRTATCSRTSRASMPSRSACRSPGSKGREDTMKLIEALEGLEMKESDDFPQGDKTLRKEDHQAFTREFLFELRGGKHKILEVIPKDKTVVPAACKFA